MDDDAGAVCEANYDAGYEGDKAVMGDADKGELPFFDIFLPVLQVFVGYGQRQYYDEKLEGQNQGIL